MDNTRVITPNGTPYGMANEKLFKSSANLSSQKSAPRFDPRKGFTNSGPMYTMCSGGGAQILMNTHSITTATNLQFMPPSRTKTTLCNDIGLSNMPTIKVLRQATFSTAVLSAVTKPIDIFSKTNTHTRTATGAELLIEHNKLVISSSSNSRSSSNMNDSNKSFCNDKPGLDQESTDGNPIVNSIKSFLRSYLWKPIIDTKTMFVGSDNNAKSSPDPMLEKHAFWNDSDSFVALNKNHKTTSMYCDNHSSDSFPYSSEKSTMPETYFDCDDYIDGGEDTIDFIASSTKGIQWDSFSDEFTADMPVHPSTKDNIFYDCINKKAAVSVTPPPQPTPPLSPSSSPSPVKLPEPVESDTKLELNVNTADESSELVQYNDDNAPINCPENEKPNRNSYRRKRRAKRKHKSNVQRKKSGSNKNRHEKIRHEVEMNIHEDIDDCSIVENGNMFLYEPDDDDEPEIDLEIIDLDDNSPKSPTINTSLKSIAGSSDVCIETPIPSPEVIPSGCIFTRFFRIDNLNCKQKQQSLPLRCIQKLVPHVKSLRDRPVFSRRISETESDDSFIVFEECSPKSTTTLDDLMPQCAALADTYKRQRHLSDCSDDFILFTEDVDDCYTYTPNCYTTDEDFTDSTDDSDCSDDGKH